jgi:hypothetical protein
LRNTRTNASRDQMTAAEGLCVFSAACWSLASWM